ncbi:LA2681 family HEPN domain-containing protein [Pseudomonas viridiflava]|uniref:LA2681 family HEPN domain-containing protein n=1 Tax=Pseudomonas viridiflava TaxID=33069 RepID=UPI0013DAA8D1|nr:LA2681 family HEPN domain-containing protein [Pseudomonas viridiflava]
MKQDFHQRFTQPGYVPKAGDRHYLLRALKALVGSGGPSSRFRRIFESLIDAAGDAKDEVVLRDSIGLVDAILRACSEEDACIVLYSASNAWAELRRAEVQPENAENLDHPALLKQLYFLHAAILHPGFKLLTPGLRARTYCNLGNALSACGRLIEAFAEWRNALDEIPIHGMALGNLGIGLVTYGLALYDPGHTFWFFVHGRRSLESAIAGGVGRDGATYPDAIEYFKRYQAWVADRVDDESDSELLEHSLGRSKEERRYRQWCLDAQLFLNPMNDLGALPVASYDVLRLPNHNAQVGITYLGFYNQLKQEYGYARHCLYQGEHSQSLHLADKGMALALNYDYALYGMGLEQIKTAFRSAYSLLDKVAYFVNAYWKLGIPERDVSFRTLWFKPVPPRTPAGTPRVIRDEFKTTKNTPLRALYWVSQDIHSKVLKDVARPDAQALDQLRNHLEHKYAKIVDEFHWIGTPSEHTTDHLAFVIDREDLVAKTLLLLKLSRSALIYLCLAMHYQESQAEKDGESLIVELPVDDYPDDLKT